MRPVAKPSYELLAAVLVLLIGLVLRACHIDTVVDAVVFLAAGYLFRGGVNNNRRKP
jgi:hypothetical protein